MSTLTYKSFAEYTSQLSASYTAAAGDFILVVTVNYGQQQGTISGFTAGDKFNGITGDVRTSIEIFYKFEPSATSGTITFNSSTNNYSAKYVVIFSGVSQTTPLIVAGNINNSGTTISTGSISTTSVGYPMLFFGQMPNSGGTVPTFTGTPTGYTSAANTAGQSGWMRAQAWRYTSATDTQPSRPAQSVTSNYSNYGVGVMVLVNQGNDAPVVTSQTPKQYNAIGLVTAPASVYWTYSDFENNTQYKYEISYREAGTTGSYTTFTSANGVTTTSHTFSAGTFVDGKEYEWRLRLDDNQGSGWSPYYTEYFTAGISKWTYGPPVTTASSTSVTTTRTFATYDFESGVDGWQNNSFFGTYTDCTFTNSTTRPKTGTRSMEITWPTALESRLISPTLSGFEIGKRYRITADIYVPAGSPIVTLDPFLQSNGLGGVVIDKDQWVFTVSEFNATQNDVTFALKTANSTSGNKAWIDNVKIESIPPEQGNYVIQVRTSDAEGFGPWSGNSNTFAFRTAPVAEYLSLTPQRVGSNITVNWKYRDVDSQAQTKYKIRYRKK